jgi:hypothetical protein
VHPSGKWILGPKNLAFMYGPDHKALRKSFLSLFTTKALGIYASVQVRLLLASRAARDRLPGGLPRAPRRRAGMHVLRAPSASRWPAAARCAFQLCRPLAASACIFRRAHLLAAQTAG